MEFPFDKEKPRFIKSVDLLLLLQFLWFPFLPKYIYTFYWQIAQGDINIHRVYKLSSVIIFRTSLSTVWGRNFCWIWLQISLTRATILWNRKHCPCCCELKMKSALYLLTPNFSKEAGDSGRKGEDPRNFRTVPSANFSWPTGIRAFRAFSVCEREIYSFVHSFIHLRQRQQHVQGQAKEKKLLSGKWLPQWHNQYHCHLHNIVVSDLFHSSETIFFCLVGLFNPGDPSPLHGYWKLAT